MTHKGQITSRAHSYRAKIKEALVLMKHAAPSVPLGHEADGNGQKRLEKAACDCEGAAEGPLGSRAH